MTDNDEPIDLDKVRKGDRLLDEAERLREESGREKRAITHDDLESIMNDDQQTFSVRETADLVGYSPETIRRNIRAGKLKAAGSGKGGEPYRISRVELARWWRDKGGGDLFATDKEAHPNLLVEQFKAARESADSDSWAPTRQQVARLARRCAHTTYEFYQTSPMLEWEHDGPKADDWSAFHEAFGINMRPDDEPADWFTRAYEQVIERLRNSTEDSED